MLLLTLLLAETATFLAAATAGVGGVNVLVQSKSSAREEGKQTLISTMGNQNETKQMEMKEKLQNLTTIKRRSNCSPSLTHTHSCSERRRRRRRHRRRLATSTANEIKAEQGNSDGSGVGGGHKQQAKSKRKSSFFIFFTFFAAVVVVAFNFCLCLCFCFMHISCCFVYVTVCRICFTHTHAQCNNLLFSNCKLIYFQLSSLFSIISKYLAFLLTI